MTDPDPVGWKQHREGVARLLASYAAIPADAPVRLSKKTSNLFRPRERHAGHGLDVSRLGGVIEVDPQACTAEVQGMCTYEHLVDATLPHGLIPLVVPQLRTITLGGAVTGLGIESTSFRSGLPHESVLEMDVLTGSGEVVTTGPGDELFRTFPNSYGSLGYATRLRIQLEPVPRYVELRHVRFADFGLMAKVITEIVETHEWEGEQVDGLDGVVFAPEEGYLTLAQWVSTSLVPEEVAQQPSRRATNEDSRSTPLPTSDYTGSEIYYRSLQQRETDLLTMYDYLWRWDTDWFWCSRAFGAQHPVVRRIWPRRWRRSDVYHRLVGLDHRLGIAARLDRRAGRPQAERVVQDVEVPVDRLEEFLAWFDEEVGMRPVWLCPLRLRVSTDLVPEEVAQQPSRRATTEEGSTDEAPGADGGRPWPTYPLERGVTYVNVGFWGAVAVGDDAPDAPRNRAIEAKVHQLGGHKSLYSEAFYDKDTFDRLYDGAHLAAVKQRHDPDGRLTSLYDKAVKRR